MELSFPRTFAPGKKSSRDRKWRGTFAPRNFRSIELSFPQST